MITIQSLVRLLCIGTVIVIAGCGSSDNQVTPYTPEPNTAWQHDIEYLTNTLRSVHPNVFHTISEARLSQLSNDLFLESESLSNSEILVGILKIVSEIGLKQDGHLAVGLFTLPENTINPLKFYRFENGVYVVQASSDYEHLIGAKLEGVGGMNISDVDFLIDTLLTRDNQHSLETNRNLIYLIPEILYTMGITNTSDITDYQMTLRGESSPQDINVESVLPSQYALDVSINLPKGGLHYYLSSDQAFWMKHFEHDNVVYIKMNAVTDTSDNDSLGDLAKRVLSITENQVTENVILDLRQNNGGNNQIVDEIVGFLQSPSINEEGKLVVFTDRQTFSAAGNLAADIKSKTNAKFVGVSPGGAGNQYGDVNRFDLPNSRLAIFIPTKYWEFGEQNDTNIMLPMDLELDVLAADYFNGKDTLLNRYIDEGSY